MNNPSSKKPHPAKKAVSAIAVAAMVVAAFASAVMSANQAYAYSPNNILINVSVSPSSGSISAGQSARISMNTARPAGALTVAGACTVNGQDVSSTMTNVAPGLYTFMYNVASTDPEQVAGALPINCTVADGNGATTLVNGFTDGDTLAIDTNGDGTIGQPATSTATSTPPDNGGGNNGGSGSGPTPPATPAPSISQVTATPSTGVLLPGSSVNVTMQDANSTDGSVVGTCSVNDVDVAHTFTDLGNGSYRVTYTASSTDADRAAGQIPISCSIQNGTGATTVNAFTDGNTLGIDTDAATTTNSGTGGNGTTTPPTTATTTSSIPFITAVTAFPDSGTISVGQSLAVFFQATSSLSDVSLNGACDVNDADVSGSFQSLGSGLYRVMYVASSTDSNRAAGQVPLSCALQSASDGTTTISAFTDSNTVAIDVGQTGTTTDNGGDGGGSSNNNSTTTGSMTGTVSGGEDAQLAVASITPVMESATAGGGYDAGWSWIFHITVPSDETHLAMKFSDWSNSDGSATIPAGGNMRISSDQAVSTSTASIDSSGTYSLPLTLTGDEDPNTAGRQVDIKVEMQVPTETVNGSYSTSYGAQSNP